ncbi:gluconate 2-dehydrogenase subunit 3 family protein [Haliscomenobacter sp.]|uniref:gluconate 2-dehydrogenase subunit 3 family protein n=1 Tax=Haliscomenobacter sp. TaxID=2717303 RepID=UPI003364F5F9
MERRDAIKYTASILGISILGAETFLAGCTNAGDKASFFSTKEIRLLDEIGETILPETDRSPGAKAAQIGAFISSYVGDCYSAEEQEIFKLGLQNIQQIAQEKYGQDFLNTSPADRLTLLTELDKTAKAHGDAPPVHYFAMMKQLAILGYFSSKPGVTQAMRYNPVPGGYDGCVEYQEGDRAWYGALSSIG